MLSQGGFIVNTETGDETCYKPQETQSNHCVGDFKPKIRARDQLLGGHESGMKTLKRSPTQWGGQDTDTILAEQDSGGGVFRASELGFIPAVSCRSLQSCIPLPAGIT